MFAKVVEGEKQTSDFDLDLTALFKSHTFIQGMTGSTKTNLILKLVELVKKERPDVQVVFLDDQEEYTDLPEFFDFVLVSKKTTPKSIQLEKAFQVGKQTRLTGTSIVIKLDDFEKQENREEYVAEFLKGYFSLGKQVGTPAIICIDEADQYCPTKTNRGNIVSRYPIINMMKRARKLNVTMILATQSLHEVDIRARKECANRICGMTTEPRDKNVVQELMGLTPEQKNDLFDMREGEFYVRGKIFKKGVTKIYVEESKITKKQDGVAQKSTKSTKSVDLFEEAVENENDMTMVQILQEQVTDLKKQLAEVKIKSTQQFSEGYQASERNWKDKSKLEKLLE